jgi:hypothetical protein
MSKLYHNAIQVGKATYQEVIITTYRINNDVNGNPRYKLAVWTFSQTEHGEKYGHQWTPKVKGYKQNKEGEYILHGVYDLDTQIKSFVNAFEASVNV